MSTLHFIDLIIYISDNNINLLQSIYINIEISTVYFWLIKFSAKFSFCKLSAYYISFSSIRI